MTLSSFNELLYFFLFLDPLQPPISIYLFVLSSELDIGPATAAGLKVTGLIAPTRPVGFGLVIDNHRSWERRRVCRLRTLAQLNEPKSPRAHSQFNLRNLRHVKEIIFTK